MLTIDFQSEESAIIKLVNDAVSAYSLGHANPELKSEFSPMTRMDLVFWLGDGVASPCIFLHIDTREKSEPDGVRTHSEFRMLELPHWSVLLHEENLDIPLTMVSLDGERIVVDSETDLCESVGVFLVSCLKRMRENGAFTSLPVKGRGELGVEELGGSFGWPLYEKRGEENCIN